MKELKYQAWHIPEKKMYDSVLSLHWLYGEDLHEIQVDTENGPIIINDFILREYTGIKDKNGLEDIYEGDIIDVDGLKKGNVYENKQEETDLVIEGFGTKTWVSTYQKAMERGCKNAE